MCVTFAINFFGQIKFLNSESLFYIFVFRMPIFYIIYGPCPYGIIKGLTKPKIVAIRNNLIGTIYYYSL